MSDAPAPFLTRQELFDLSLEHGRKQGRPGAVLSDPTNCKYRATASDGAIVSCLIGARIPDTHYDPMFDAGTGTSVCGILGRPGERARKFRAALVAGRVNPDDLQFLSELQASHDNASSHYARDLDAARTVHTVRPKPEWLPLFEQHMERLRDRYRLTHTPK